MWLWRRVSRRRWKPSDSAPQIVDLSQAMLDLKDDALSLFKVDSASDAEHLTIIWAPTCCPNPQPIHYLLLPDACFTDSGLLPKPTPDPGLHPFLSERHYEVAQVDDEKAKEIAASVVARYDGVPSVQTVRERETSADARSLSRRRTPISDVWSIQNGG